MRIALGTFARSGIEAQLGGDLDAAVQAALCHYAGKLKSGRPPIGLPSFARKAVASDTSVALDLAVDSETEALLKREAARQKTSLSQLVAHTVLVYLAELDFLTSPTRPV
jgi:hypothetical protein